MLLVEVAFIILQVAVLSLPKPKVVDPCLCRFSAVYTLFLSCHVHLYSQILHFGDKVILEDPIERFAFPLFTIFA